MWRRFLGAPSPCIVSQMCFISLFGMLAYIHIVAVLGIVQGCERAVPLHVTDHQACPGANLYGNGSNEAMMSSESVYVG